MKKKKQIDRMMDEGAPLLLHFYKSGCLHNEAVRSSLKRLKRSGAPLQIFMIEVSKLPDLVDDYDVEGAPSVILFHQGEEKWRRSGMFSEKQLLKALAAIELN